MQWHVKNSNRFYPLDTLIVQHMQNKRMGCKVISLIVSFLMDGPQVVFFLKIARYGRYKAPLQGIKLLVEFINSTKD